MTVRQWSRSYTKRPVKLPQPVSETGLDDDLVKLRARPSLEGAWKPNAMIGKRSWTLAAASIVLSGGIALAVEPESGADDGNVAPSVVSLPGRGPELVLEALVLSGFSDDPPGRSGLASATASLVAKAMSGLPAGETADMGPGRCRDIDRLSGRNITRFRMRFPIDRLEPCYPSFRDALIAPSFEPGDVESPRTPGAPDGEEPATAEGAGLRQAAAALHEMLYRDRPRGPGKEPAGAPITRDEIRAFHATHYTRRGMILGAAGPGSDGLADRMRVDFAALPSGVERPARARTVLPRRRVIVVETGKPGAVSIAIGQPLLVTRMHPDYVPLRVAVADLGGERHQESRLFQALRADRALTSSPVASFDACAEARASGWATEPDPDLTFSILFDTTPELAKFSLKVAVSELQAFVEEGVPAERLEKIKTSVLRGQESRSSDPAADLERSICETIDGGAGLSRRWPRSVEAVTAQQVQSAIRAQVHPDRIGIAAVVPDAEAFIGEMLSQETRMEYGAAGDRDRNRDRDLQIVGLDLGLRREDFEIVVGSSPAR